MIAYLCAFVFVFQSAFLPNDAEPADDFTHAREETTESGKPLLVMVGTDWCGPCQAMKKNILPKVREHGLFRKVAFALVNADRNKKLADELTGGGPVPQMVLYYKSDKGWMRRKLIGGQSVEAVEKFIEEGLVLNDANKKSMQENDAVAKLPETAETKTASKDKHAG